MLFFFSFYYAFQLPLPFLLLCWTAINSRASCWSGFYSVKLTSVSNLLCHQLETLRCILLELVHSHMQETHSLEVRMNSSMQASLFSSIVNPICNHECQLVWVAKFSFFYITCYAFWLLVCAILLYFSSVGCSETSDSDDDDGTDSCYCVVM